jgi:hypothetical protein
MNELIFGVVLLALTCGLAFACFPRHGKVVAFVRKPFVGPLVSVLIVTGLTISVLLIVAYFSNFDDITLVGAKRL